MFRLWRRVPPGAQNELKEEYVSIPVALDGDIGVLAVELPSSRPIFSPDAELDRVIHKINHDNARGVARSLKALEKLRRPSSEEHDEQHFARTNFEARSHEDPSLVRSSGRPLSANAISSFSARQLLELGATTSRSTSATGAEDDDFPTGVDPESRSLLYSFVEEGSLRPSVPSIVVRRGRESIAVGYRLHQWNILCCFLSSTLVY